MAYFHGVRASEIPTAILATVSSTAGLPVILGTAPVHQTLNPEKYVNRPVLCYSWDEAVAALGYSSDWQKYTLCEAMYTEFKLYGTGPAVFVNVLDPKKHKKQGQTFTVTVREGKGIIEAPVILSTLKVKKDVGDPDSATLGTDYAVAHDDDGNAVIKILDSGNLKDALTLSVEYEEVDAAAVTSTDIIGGVASDGTASGMENVDVVFPKISLVPGMIAAPGWSEKPEVAAVMKAKSASIDKLFRCLCLCDIDTSASGARMYQDVNTWKNKHGYTGENQVACWPCVQNGDNVYHFSSHLMGVIGVMDARNSDVPYQSPSNCTLQATGLCLKDGTEVALTPPQANLLNSQGVMTGLNFIGGWKTWGNYTGAYPSTTDVKDTFIAVRRMFDWQYQTFITQYWSKVDQPMTPRLIKTIIDTEQVRLNGLAARGYLLGAKVQFLSEENPTTDLLAGIIRFHVSLTPPVPAQEINQIIEYDVNNFKTLFSN